jgi:hypothetical protein
MSKSEPLTLMNCVCGTTPLITTELGIMSKTIGYFYKCPKCATEGEMKWPSDGEIVVKSWNHTINTIVNHVRNKKT